MALICMAVHDTEENGRTEYTKKTIQALLDNVSQTKHTIVIIDNNSCEATHKVYKGYLSMYKQMGSAAPFSVIYNNVNVGTAKAINQGLAMRSEGQYAIKIDNDVVIEHNGWATEMEEAMRRMPKLGILGLKRKDLKQRPDAEAPFWRSELLMVPQEPGQRWYVVEKADDIMGTCTMFSPELLEKIGGLRQPGVYGWDDVDYCYRSQKSGFINAFLPHIEIEHIDVGGTPYCAWKTEEAGAKGKERLQWQAAYDNGTMPLYQPLT